MNDDTVSILREVLVRELGVGEVNLLGPDVLTLHWFGFDYLMNGQSSKWLHLGIVLDEAGPPEGSQLNQLALAQVPAQEVRARVAYLNNYFPNLRFTMGGAHALWIEWTGFAFGRLTGPDAEDLDPLPEGFDTRTLDPAEIAGMLEVAMEALRSAILMTFQVFGQIPRRQPRGFPMAVGRVFPDSFRLFHQALVSSELPFNPSMTEVSPSLYFLDGSGAAFHLVAFDLSTGGYVLHMEFFEARIFQPDASAANVIDGRVDQNLLDVGASVASGMLGMKAYGSTENGYVVCSTSGVLPADDPDAVATLLPFLTGTLAAFAEMLFAQAGVRILTHDQERARRTA